MSRSAIILLLALTAGCRPAGESRPAVEAARLEPPTSSSAAPAGLLGPVSTGYDNVQQALYLQKEAKRLGISSLDKPSGPIGESGEAGDPVTYEEGVMRTKAMAEQFAAQRRAIEKGRPKPVGLDGETPGLIPGKPQGGPIEVPKDLENP